MVVFFEYSIIKPLQADHLEPYLMRDLIIISLGTSLSPDMVLKESAFLEDVGNFISTCGNVDCEPLLLISIMLRLIYSHKTCVHYLSLTTKCKSFYATAFIAAESDMLICKLSLKDSCPTEPFSSTHICIYICM